MDCAKDNPVDNPIYYLPHHGVHRPDKPSTPLPVVFDRACKYKGESLNSFLLKGPCLTGDLLGVLLRFRENPVVIVGDISKMFLQILLTERDSQVHRFLWRNLDVTRDPTTYRLTRVTFGDKPSPAMAGFVMLKLAMDYGDTYPESADILRYDRYMDDMIHSCQSPSEAIKKMEGLNKILAHGSFKVKEWFSSSEEVKEHMDRETRPKQSNYEKTQFLKTIPDITLGEQDNLKTLGVYWNPDTDTIHFKVKDSDTTIFTKRSVLSKLSMLYDPLGLASVVTIKARVAMQDIWKMKNIDWDDPLLSHLCELWQQLFREMKTLETIQSPRCLRSEKTLGVSELHVFADASAVAYGAVAYLLWATPEGPSVRLVSAKTRVAPLRQTTIPRLELMASLVTSRLAKTIYDELKEKPRVVLWSDSQIVLHWIGSTTFKAFIGVRIAEIQSTRETVNWRFVPSNLNPADDLSRGIEVKAMSGRWINGPEFLYRPKDEWPEQPQFCGNYAEDEVKKTKPVCANVKIKSPIDCKAFSSWKRLVRVTAYCFRFIQFIKSRQTDPSEIAKGMLQPEELERAEVYWIQLIEGELSDWKERYRDLSPFVQDGIVRVGGRLRRSSEPYEQVHPILLPSSNFVSKLILRDIHEGLWHPGCERTLCESRRKNWVLRGRNQVRPGYC